MARPLLILDIDETLLYASTVPLETACDYIAERTWVYKRPYVDTFLSQVAEKFELAVWSSARASYVEEICSNVFPNISFIFTLSCEHCLSLNIDGMTQSVKPIGVLAHCNIDMRRVLMVDNSPQKHCLNPEYLVTIPSYYADSTDTELLQLSTYLKKISQCEDFTLVSKNYHLQ